jgi:PAS domain S-box-containing protein
VHPDDLAAVEFDMGRLPPPGAFLDSEFRILLSDGTFRWITAHALVRYDDRREPIEIIGVNWDVTAEKEAEATLRVSDERNRLAIAANNLGTWDYDMATGRHLWSPEFRELWGLPLDAPADPKLLQPLVEAKDWEHIRSIWTAAAAGDGRIELEYQVRRQGDGQRRWLQFRGQMFFGEQGEPVRAICIVMDTSDRRQAEERQRLLLNELNHRVKNTLATVQAIVSQTLRATPDPDEAFERVQARLMALSNTHNLLNATSWAGARLVDILNAELGPYRGPSERIKLNGHTVALDAKTALAFGLIVHELATNAAKYGSLSAQDGRVEVAWHEWGQIGAGVELVWRELDGPPVARPAKRGFGSRLIERSAKDLNGTVELDFAETGLTCRLAFSLSAVPADSP